MQSSPHAPATRHKVLLVDDDAVSLELMAMLLAYEGHQVVRATGAEAALSMLASEKASRPDVLLVDLQMPGISGGQLAERVRAMKGPNPLLLAMSATEVQRQQVVAFDGFLLKPLALGDLQKALQPKQLGVARPAAKSKEKPMKLSSQCEVVDTAVVAKLLAMMPVESLHEVIVACLADTRECVRTMRIQQQLGDSEGLGRSAHRVKGAAAMIGASYLAKLAAGLESGGSKVAATPSVLDDLLSACIEVRSVCFPKANSRTTGPPTMNPPTVTTIAAIPKIVF